MPDRFLVAGAGNWNAANTAIWSATSGGAAGASAPTTNDDVYADAASGAGTLTTAAGAACKSLNFRGTGGASNFAGTWAGSAALTISDGGLVMSPTMTRTYTGGLTFASTSGTTRNVTSNGKTFAGGFGFNGVGGVFVMTDTFLTTGAMSLTNGSLTLATSTTAGTFNTNNNNTRTLTMTGCTFTLTGTGTVFTTGNTTGLTLNAVGSLIDITDASAVAKLITSGVYVFGSFRISGAGTGGYTFGTAAGPTYENFTLANTGGATVTIQHDVLNLTGNFVCTAFTGTLMGSSDAKTLKVMGNITLGAAMTYSAVAGTRLRVETTGTSGTQLITSNGKSFPISFRVNGVGGTTKLADAFSVLSTFSVENGSFISDGKTMSVNQLQSNFTSTRTVNLDGSAVTLFGVNTVWTTFDPTGLTFSNVGTTITITDGSLTDKIFNGGGQSFNSVTYGGVGGVVGQLIITGNNSFGTLALQNAPQKITFESGSTQTVTNISIPFVAGSPNILSAFTPGSQATVSKAANDVTTDYATVTDIRFTGGARWFLGQHSTNVGNNNGARFTNKYRTPMMAVGG